MGGGLRNAWKYHDIGTAPSSGSLPRCCTSSGFFLFCLSSTGVVKGEGKKNGHRPTRGPPCISASSARLSPSRHRFPSLRMFYARNIGLPDGRIYFRPRLSAPPTAADSYGIAPRFVAVFEASHTAQAITRSCSSRGQPDEELTTPAVLVFRLNERARL